MMGVDATHVDDDRLCCSSSRQGKFSFKCSLVYFQQSKLLELSNGLGFFVFLSAEKVCSLA